MSTATSIPDTCFPCFSRRAALVGAAGAALALAGCSSGDDAEASPTTSAGGGGPEGSAAPGSSPAPGSSAAAGGGAGGALASVADVPVGGGIILADAKIVLTQPEAGTIMAFSATCTHAGCAVTNVADGAITCPCHGSSFSITDGAVLGGPAPSPLPEQQITVDGDSITLA